MNKRPVEHGTNRQYNRGCRCDRCKKAHSIAMGRNELSRKRGGGPQTLVDAAPAAAYLRLLFAQGYSASDMAAASGVSKSRILALCRSDGSSRVRRETLDAIMGACPTRIVSPGKVVPRAPFERMVSLLRDNGVTNGDICREAGLSYTVLMRRDARGVQASSLWKLQAAWPKLWSMAQLNIERREDRNAGLIRGNPTKRPKYTDDDRIRAVEMLDGGLSRREVADLYGIGYSSFGTWVRRVRSGAISSDRPST